MKDSQKTKKQLIEELQQMREQLATHHVPAAMSPHAGSTVGKLEEIHGSLFDMFPMGVTILDMKGTVLYCNAAVYQKSGHPPGKFEGKHFSKIATLRAKDIPGYLVMFKSLLKGKMPEPFETQYQRKDGSTGWTELNISLLNIGGERRIVVIQHDTTERKRIEETLRESEQKYKTLVEETAFGILNADLTGKITYVNNAILQTTGYSWEELVGKNAFRLGLIPGETLKLLKNKMKEKLLGQPPGRMEMQFKRKDGKWIWLQIRGSLLRVLNIPVGFHCTGEDITEQKRAEEALKDSEEKFRIASQLASDVVYERDLQTGIATFYGDIDTHLGYEQEGFSRTMEGWREHVHPEDLAWIDGQSLDHLEQGTPYEIEYRMKRKDGTYMTWLDRIMVTKDKETGKPAKIIGAATDITERKQAEEALRDSEEKFNIAFHSSPQAMLITDLKDGKIIEVNESHYRITGHTRDELIGRSTAELDIWVNNKDRSRIVKTLKEKGTVINEEIEFRKKSGEIYTGNFSAEVINLGGEECIISSVMDITERKKMEEALRESEIKFSKAFQSSPNMITLINLNTNQYVEVNDSFINATGYSREELMNSTRDDINLWVYPEEEEKMGRLLAEDDKMRNEELHFRMKSGEIRTWLCSADIINIGGDRCMLAAAADITERNRAEEALANEAIWRRILIDESLDGIVVLDEDAAVVEANRQFAEMLGYSPEEVRNLHTWDWDTELEREELLKMGRGIGPEGLHLETRHRRKDGTVFDVDISISGAMVTGRKLIFCVCRDVTARKQAEEAMRESEEKFSKAFRSSPEVITITRLSDGKFLEVNDSFVRATGYSREEIIGHCSQEMGIWAKPGDRERMLKILKEKGRVSNEEYSMRTKSGDIRVMLYSTEQVTLGNEPCLLAVTFDITDYRKMEAKARETEYLRELDKLRTELLANISHELRTPLASIKGFATMLIDYEDRLTRHEKKDYLETIDKNTDRLVELIEQLLEMSRLEAGMLSITKKSTNILKLCEEAVEEVCIRSATHNFTLDLPAKLPRVNADGRRIRQILDNIIDNSVKFSDEGTEINLTLKRKGDNLLFTVSDHGTGIAQQDLPRVFNRMFHSPKKPGVAGAGLGLSICRGLVEAHGGEIWIESEEGKGTRCFFTLPLYNGEGEQA
ncbi:MAG: PAS domain S-box protein [Dehalococcoidales bacterium]|nr:PAS domain S-box protein [Dehalococcoidales bacterium]